MKMILRLVLPLFAVLSLESSALGDAWRARQVFNLCSSCHGSDGQGNVDIKAPPIAGMPEWYLKAQLEKFRAGTRGAHPKDFVGLRMRPMGRALDDNDLALVAGYVASLPVAAQPETVKANLVKGEATYQVCVACHGAKGEGNQQLGAPPIVQSADWYLLDQLAKFKAAIRGGNPAVDPIGASMQAISTTLDEEAMKNVIAYINTLKPTH